MMNASNAYQQTPAMSATPQLQPGQGLLRVNIQGSVMTSSMIVPRLMVDGYEVNPIYGANAFAVAAGRHHVELYAQWMRRYGQASMAVDVPAGSVLDVFYAAPLHQFATGNIGLTKQPRKGMALFAIMLAFVLVVVVGAMVANGFS
jgi:hypothetical protein